MKQIRIRWGDLGLPTEPGTYRYERNAAVAASGVSGRTLLQHFRDSKGVSPIRYLRNARFAKVRDALAQSEPADSVTAIALRWGFSHMGRFAVEYRKRFGESPSQTLRRRRISGWSRADG
jgi:transcriptional regulator GlxA family with amidase domain